MFRVEHKRPPLAPPACFKHQSVTSLQYDTVLYHDSVQIQCGSIPVEPVWHPYWPSGNSGFTFCCQTEVQELRHWVRKRRGPTRVTGTHRAIAFAG